jgi:hypothetical protein
MTQTTINGNTYSDDGTASKDMRNGGHKLWLLPMVADVAAVGAAAATSASAAAAAAASAASSAASLVGTSSSSVAIGTGSKSFTASTGRQWGVGQYLIVVDHANSANTMTGQITAYNSGTGALTINVTAVTGTGTISLWDIYVSGVVGATGPGGPTGASGNSRPRLNLSSNTTLAAGDNGKLVVCTGTFTLTLPAPGTAGANWETRIWNAGTGVITLQHTSGQVDGLNSYALYPGAVRDANCDGTTFNTVPLVGGVITFTASGTWIQPPRVKALVRCTGAGASGGAGARQASGVASDGGPGGGGGEQVERLLTGIAAGTSVTVTIPAQVNGAASATVDGTAAAAGTNGGNCTFGSYLTAYGGKASSSTGDILTSTAVNTDPGGVPTDAGSGSQIWLSGRLFQARIGAPACGGDGAGGGGGNGKNGTSMRAGLRSQRGGGGGGGGGSIDTSNVGQPGGAGGATGLAAGPITTLTGFGGAGGSVGSAGSVGTARTDSSAGDGGGGGGAGVAAAAGAGADGNAPGGGGGGGGGSRNGFASGAGGKGARGECTVVELV